MSAIDSLLKLMDSQGADGLVIAANDVPTLDMAGETLQLSMPAVPAALVATFAGEVIGPDGADDLEGGRTLEGTYRSADGASFAYEVSPRAQGCRLSLRPLGTRTPPPDDPGPGLQEPPEPLTAIEDQTTSPARSVGHEEPVHVGSAAPDTPDPVLLSAIGQALEQGASDLFFSTGEHPRIRVGGVIEAMPGLVTGREHILALAGGALDEDRGAELRTRGSVDLAVELDIAGSRRRFRASLFQHHHGLAVALRPIRDRAPSLEELNLPGDLCTLCSLPHGLVLLTGAAGSGKSTTLASLVEHINRTRACHIITLEDPIEFEHDNQRSIVHQREVGRHVESFSAGLRAALRESPDVILLGEMRDLPTIAAALTAAETGHLVLSTLHTGDASSAIDRIIDVFPGHQQPQARLQLASVLRAIVTQILVPSTQHPGRVPAIEKLVITDGVACQIRDGRNHQVSSLIQAGGSEGMITLERSLASLVRAGKVALTTALHHARDEQGLRKLVRGAR
ncbi:MAG: PilT/PilU family type 4a pilus ATPase [Deltaproteobacteria bacterium]|nr:PilT/PilU family type 4a pilus ATPase [Deltaproteobacteria bacterium]